MAAAYSAEKRARVMGALWATVRWEGPEPKPRMAEVARDEGLPIQTVSRWWHSRNRDLDVTYREPVARAREAAAEAGATDWLHSSWLRVQAGCAHLLNEDNWTEKTHTNSDGDVVVLRHAPRLTDIAKSLEIAAGLLKPVGDALGLDEGKPDDSNEVADLEAAMRAKGWL